ncbi:MAG TPA: VOC family protein [Gaiellaceae bacterium]|nr:VOC family protein [Gaiellaceae bacterium]
MKLVHFEIPAADVDRAKSFWGDLFGWRFSSWDGPLDYHVTEAGGGPGGAVFPSDDPGSGPIVYFAADDIDAAVAKVHELGGTVEQDKQPIPGIGWFARCRDTEGNRFSLFQSDERAALPIP